MSEPNAHGSVTEHRAQKTFGWTYDEEAKDFVRWDGLEVRWRFVGERKWRKVNVISTGGQTIEGLRSDLPLIVERLADRARADS